jgi:methyl-accepting chemotaxis protein
MKDFRIGTRLVAGFAVVISIAFAFGAFAYIKMSSQDPAIDQLTKVTLPAVYLSDDSRSSVQRQYALFQQFLMATDRAQQDSLEAALKSERARNTELLAKLDALPFKSDASLKSAQDQFLVAVDGAMNIIRPSATSTTGSGAPSGTINEEARKQALLNETAIVRPAYEKYLTQTAALAASCRTAADEQRPNADASRLLIWLAGALLFCFALSSLIIRGITSPLTLGLHVLEHASEGDLTYRAEITSHDELGLLLAGLNTQLEHQSVAAGIIDRLADGDLAVPINPRSDKDVLGRALLRLRNSILVSVDLAERLADGNLAAPKLAVSDKDRLAMTLIRLRDRMKETMELAEKICDGNLKAEVRNVAESDHLAQSLLRMRASLQTGIQLAEALSLGDLSAEPAALSTKDRLANSLLRVQSFLSAAARAINKISEGDLSVSIAPLSANDVLGRSLVRMLGTLRQNVSDVILSAEHIGSTSGDVISTAAQLSSGSNQHAEVAAETSSVIGNLAMSLRHSAGNSQQTEKLATAAAEEGALGGEAVSQTVVVMKEVAERINLLDDIARKTDMLTLAAAVEAARAGEHGTGFGVVASELRKLVERTQTAASEIVRLTTGGVKTAECAGEFMSRMVPGVRRTAELVREIATATEEQNQDAVRAGKSIQTLDEVIHRNVSASRQMAATAEDLVIRTKALKSAASFFKLDAEEDAQQPLAALQKGAGS